MPHGQFIIGAPGSGKTTYSQLVQNLLNQLSRHALYINLDPANESFASVSQDIRSQFEEELQQQQDSSTAPLQNPSTAESRKHVSSNYAQYEHSTFHIDIMDIVSLSNVQKELKLGPNGGLIYCLEYIHKFGLKWIRERINELAEKYDTTNFYYLIDCPGQVELFTNESESIRGIISFFQNELNVNLCAVNLFDAQYCVEPSKYIGALLTCLNSQISLELPHVNVMSKMDLIQVSEDLDESQTKYGALPFRLKDYLNFGNMSMLLEQMPQGQRFTKLNGAIIELLENWNHVSFVPLNIEKKSSIVNLLRHIDKANGYIFASSDVQKSIYNQSYMDKLEEEENEELF